MLKNKNNIAALVIMAAYLITILINTAKPLDKILSPISSSWQPLKPLVEVKNTREVFGFAPYWNLDKLDNIDFDTLTTLAYFDVKVDGQGNLITDDSGYESFKSRKATELFKKAHRSGTKVVLTLTQMNSYEILAILDNPEAQDNLIEQSVSLVKKRGIDGINFDFELGYNPGYEYTKKFTRLITNLNRSLHREIPSSKLTVSVYASAVKDHKIYDIGELAKNSDGIFMMAYDFAVADSDTAMPTSPLYGHKEGEYWYDVSTAVEDFLTQMPSEKLILGVPWYGYSYAVYEPKVKSQTNYWYGGVAQTYASIVGDTPDRTGWDNAGKVGWKAYYDPYSGTWRMVFIEDKKSLKIKYDFIKNKNLGGIGIWALGNDEGRRELWDQLKDNFKNRLAKDYSIIKRIINENI